ncbi:growth hormone-regulated TBC protein 1-like isoform X2 [Sphaeramia orbicularis]|uniref:growth hormone-regulated TBC protein 1-like isoform X2 n=1 Tax=Sphaeramia orbicularis TaxID=375764 RepID=UPI00117C2C56|nr:growth hormone-regulated TBC protein 1-like isoform X2 [Sphaeramia orbicularis]
MEKEIKGNASQLFSSNNANERTDPYGFERPRDFESYKDMMNEYVAVLNRRSMKWSKLLQGKSHVEKNMTDMHRTFPDNVLFQSKAENCLQSTLYNVLLAYGHHNKTVGYCQGMNFIAGYLIIITKDEEKSFWLMDALLGRILPDYYSPAMLGLKTDQEVLGELVKAKAPAVGQLMAQYPGIWTLVVSRWFICLYIDILPIETVLRVWDCLFYEGSKVLFRVALTLVLHHQSEILRARSLSDVCECFKQITHGAFTMDCHTFMQKIFTEPGSLSKATIEKLRDKCTKKIQEEESGQP